jgi:putative transposase
MFNSEEEFKQWAASLSLPEETINLIRNIRASEPSRRVQSRVGNVSGRYPSKKMQRTIQFESHRNELALIYEMEHDPDVIEYWDQPPSFTLRYTSINGRQLGVVHTPDFFLIRSSSAGWVECKVEQDLIKLEDKQPNRFKKTADGRWCCLPGEDYAGGYGLSYTVHTNIQIDWTFQRNILFLEDFLLEETIDIPDEVVTYIHSLVAAKPGITLSELLLVMGKRELRADSVYQMIVTDRLYTDLSECVLAKPDKVQLYFNQEVAAMYGSSTNNPFKGKHQVPSLLPGCQLLWDEKVWEVVNRGDKQTWLRDSESRLIKLDNPSIDRLVDQGCITCPATAPGSSTGDKEIFSKLDEATPKEIAEANRRYKQLIAFQSGELAEEGQVSTRTLYYWQAKFRAAEEQSGAGYIGLLPDIHSRGNSQPKLPEKTISLMKEHISIKYEDPKQPTSYSVWTQLIKDCRERGIIWPSYQTFCQAVRNRPIHQQQSKRRGSKGAYASEPFYYELEVTTPRHGDRPFEICHIDHTELDLELSCSQTQGGLGRPWLTLLIDAYTRLILAFCLLFARPSYRSCMLVLRECVRRHNRLPQTLVMDGGSEFNSTYFEALIAFYKITKKTRPLSKPRFGAVCERLFGTTNTRFVYNLAGNTQLTKYDARVVTPEVNPKNLATWTLPDLNDSAAEFFFDVYPDLDHPALYQTPRAAFLTAQQRSGERDSRYIAYNEEFLMQTLPTTTKGTAKIIPGRGVKLNHYALKVHRLHSRLKV